MLLAHGVPPFALDHVPTGVHQNNRRKGGLSPPLLGAAVAMWLRLLSRLLRCRPRLMFLFLSQNKSGFARDALLILTAAAFGTRVVAQVQGSNFGNFYQHAHPALQRLIRLTVSRLARVILLAERHRPQFAGLLPADRIRVMPNPVAAEAFEVVQPDHDGHEGCTVFFMGHLSQAKGFVDLVAAAPTVLDAVPGARFVFAGDWLQAENNILFDESGRPLNTDPALPHQRWKALQRRYGERVQLAGVVRGPDKTSAFRSADVFAFPSYSEGFPMVVLEAMAAGLPLVVTPVGALPEVLAPGANACFVQPGDVDGLAQVLLRLAQDPAARCAMGQANRALAEQRFSVDAVVAQLSAILLEVVEPAAARSP
jgi:glycosyltransferase involved in cell wall biosynthesis